MHLKMFLQLDILANTHVHMISLADKPLRDRYKNAPKVCHPDSRIRNINDLSTIQSSAECLNPYQRVNGSRQLDGTDAPGPCNGTAQLPKHCAYTRQTTDYA